MFMTLRFGRQGTDSVRVRITWDFWRSYEKQASTMTVRPLLCVPAQLWRPGIRNQFLPVKTSRRILPCSSLYFWRIHSTPDW